MLDRHRFFGSAASLEINITHTHEFCGNGVHHAELRLVCRDWHRIADVFDRRALAAVDELVRRRDRFHVEGAHESATAHLFVDEVVRIATAHERHEEHGVKARNDLRCSTREKNHRQIDRSLEGRDLLREREIAEVGTTDQEQVRTVFRSHRAGLDKGGLVRSIRIQKHSKQCPTLLDFCIQTEFSLTRFHNKSFLRTMR